MAETPLQSRRGLEHAAHDVREAAQELELVCSKVLAAGRLERLDTLHQRAEALRHRVQKLRAKVESLE